MAAALGESERPCLMIVGLGDLGGLSLEFLLRRKSAGRIIVASRNPEKGEARCNLARAGAVAQGFDPQITFVPLDLNDQAAVGETVIRHSPDLILSTATLQTWWLADLLPAAQSHALKSAGFGVWLPVHLTLTLKLMSALRRVDYRGPVLTAPFPDVVNCVLGRLGLAPTCGVGNVDEVVAKVRLLAARRLQVPLDSVRVWLVAHHALQAAGFGESKQDIPPYFLRVEHLGRDVTEAVEAGRLLLSRFPIPAGRMIHFLTAGCIVRLISGLFSDEEALLHVPGPQGLPGGYPVRAGRFGLKMADIPGLSLSEAIRINEDSHRFDGIESVEEDGSVVFCASSAGILRKELGYDCPRLPPSESEPRARELIARFRQYGRRFGVDFERMVGSSTPR